MTTATLRRMLRRTPGLSRLVRRHPEFTTSTEYWRRRYDSGYGSGSGSRDRLAEFKAGFLNDFVTRHGVASVVELGCGDGRQLERAAYADYTGLDIAPDALAACRARFRTDATRRFELYDPAPFEPHSHRADLALSLDVIYHLVEDSVYETHLRHLFALGARFVIVYSSDHDAPTEVPHVRHRAFSTWVERHEPEWTRIALERNPHPWHAGDPTTSWSDFHVFARSDDQ